MSVTIVASGRTPKNTGDGTPSLSSLESRLGDLMYSELPKPNPNRYKNLRFSQAPTLAVSKSAQDLSFYPVIGEFLTSPSKIVASTPVVKTPSPVSSPDEGLLDALDTFDLEIDYSVLSSSDEESTKTSKAALKTIAQSMPSESLAKISSDGSLYPKVMPSVPVSAAPKVQTLPKSIPVASELSSKIASDRPLYPKVMPRVSVSTALKVKKAASPTLSKGEVVNLEKYYGLPSGILATSSSSYPTRIEPSPLAGMDKKIEKAYGLPLGLFDRKESSLYPASVGVSPFLKV